jgi:hypothetical protein
VNSTKNTPHVLNDRRICVSEGHSEYTVFPIHRRVHFEGDGWAVDGIDAFGHYTEMVWKFPTWEEALCESQSFPLGIDYQVQALGLSRITCVTCQRPLAAQEPGAIDAFGRGPACRTQEYNQPIR